MASIDLIPGFESFSVNEASRRKVHKAAKQGSYPAVIVVVQNGKVIHQEPVSTPDIAPAMFNVMQEKYPKALLHLEDNTGKRLFSESIVTEGKISGSSQEAYRLHILANKVGQEVAAEFLSDNRVDLDLLTKAIQQGTINKYELRDVVDGTAHKFKIKNFMKAFVSESIVTEGAKIETERYVRSHGKKPKGYGGWMFSYNRDGSDEWQIPNGMSWPDAQKWAKKKAKEDGEDYVYVMESVVTGFTEAKMTKDKLENLIYSLENENDSWHPSSDSKKKSMLDKLKKDLSKFESVVTEEVVYNSSNTKPEAAKKATKEFGNLLPKANKGVKPYVFAVVKTKARNYRLAIKSGSYIAHEFMSGLKEDGILTADIVKKAVANVIKMNPEEFNESAVTEAKGLPSHARNLSIKLKTHWLPDTDNKDIYFLADTNKGQTITIDLSVRTGEYKVIDKKDNVIYQGGDPYAAAKLIESVVTEAKRLSFKDAGITDTMDLSKAMDALRDSKIDWNQKGQAFVFVSSKEHAAAIKALGLDESVVTEAKNTIGLAFKEEQDYLDFKEFVAEQPRGAIRKNIGFDSKTKSWNVEMDVKILDSIYGEGTPSDKKSGWYGGLPDDFESVIIEGAISKSRFETFLNEASRRKVHKAAKQGSYPAVIVVVQDGKVIHQEPVSTPDIAPATFNVMQEKYPKALLHLEDKTGKRLFSESIVNEARQAPAKTLFKMIVKGSASEIEGVKISSAMAQAALDWFDRSTYARKYEKQVKTAGMGAVAPLIFGDNWGIKKTIPSKLKAEFKELQAKYKRVMPENESAITEAKFDKKKLMKAMKQDDGMIQLGNGQEYVIYAYDNGNDDNDAMWGDKSIFALDQDGEEHEVKYSDIVSYNEANN